MRFIVLPLVLCSLPLAMAQTVSTAPTKGTTGTGAPTQNVVITVNGKKISFLLSPANIPPLQVNIPSIPVNLSGYTGSLSCQLAPDGQIIVNPDKTLTITGLKCSIAAAK